MLIVWSGGLKDVLRTGPGPGDLHLLEAILLEPRVMSVLAWLLGFRGWTRHSLPALNFHAPHCQDTAVVTVAVVFSGRHGSRVADVVSETHPARPLVS